MPLAVPDELAQRIPRGPGNREITAADPFAAMACDAVDAIIGIADAMGWRIGRVAIDAPAVAPASGVRSCEQALGRAGLSVYRTPVAAAWTDIRAMGATHLAAGGRMTKLPHARRIWMLYGFALFAGLRTRLQAEVIEVYPYAIVHALLGPCAHKTTEAGYQRQLAAVAARTGWDRRCVGAVPASVGCRQPA